MSVYVLIKNRAFFKAKPKEILLFFGSGLSFLLTATFYYTSMQLSSVATAVVLMYTAPAIVMVYSVLFLGEKLTKLKGVAVAVMLLGCCLVSGVVGGMKFNALGILFGVLSGISYSAYNILTKIEMKKGSSAISATLYNFLFASVGAIAICNPINLFENFSNKPVFTIPVMIACGIVTCIAPYFLYTVAMKTLPAGTASALGIVEPMAATVFSVVVLHESLNVFSSIGIVLILGAVFLLGRED
jgi:drug/metabolite transporter (DMT)-like permease